MTVTRAIDGARIQRLSGSRRGSSPAIALPPEEHANAEALASPSLNERDREVLVD
jgi:hypothetical protein